MRPRLLTLVFSNILLGPQSRTLQPVRGEGYKHAYKSRANAETHPRIGAGGCGVSEGGENSTLGG